jgi:hypothetical protein
MRQNKLWAGSHIAPNPQLQRTRFAPLRSPLSRKPSGGQE